jgi:hypothetical protein
MEAQLLDLLVVRQVEVEVLEVLEVLVRLAH